MSLYILFHNTENYACGGDTVSLSCAEEGGVIDVLSALYGRAVDGSVLCRHAAYNTTYTQCTSTADSDTAKVKGRFVVNVLYIHKTNKQIQKTKLKQKQITLTTTKTKNKTKQKQTNKTNKQAKNKKQKQTYKQTNKQK